jgi:hypothetical protein
VLKDGSYHVSDRPGLGIGLDEKFDMGWGNLRRRDGTIAKP